jgi:hypothetical protein
MASAFGTSAACATNEAHPRTTKTIRATQEFMLHLEAKELGEHGDCNFAGRAKG